MVRVKRHKKTALVTVLLCCLAAQPAVASFTKAMEIYTAKKFEEAKQAFEVMASIGDRASIFNLGVMYFRGEAVTADPVKAYALMTVANEGLKDENFANIAKVVYTRLNEQQVQSVGAEYERIKAIYGTDVIEAEIFPQLLNDEDCDPEVVAVYRKPPVYPKDEARRGRMGLVYPEVTISPEGYVRDVFMTASTSKAFSDSSLVALNGYQYQPPLNGKPIMWYRMTMIYQFERKARDKYQAKTIVRTLDELKEKSQSGDVRAQYLYGLSIDRYRHFNAYSDQLALQWRDANEWFTKSAKAGVVNAQYEIGRNMINGRGCEVDEENGLKWIKAAAIGGHSPAQAYLSTSQFSTEIDEKKTSRARINWLRNAVSGDVETAKVMLAWELVTSPDESLRDIEAANSLINEKLENYHDKLRILETKALIFAHKGEFKKALKLQKKASKLAKSRQWEIAKIEHRLQAYQNNEAYLGGYY